MLNVDQFILSVLNIGINLHSLLWVCIQINQLRS